MTHLEGGRQELNEGIRRGRERGEMGEVGGVKGRETSEGKETLTDEYKSVSKVK